MAGYAVYTAGGANERANQLETQVERLNDLTDAISKGRNEVRTNNPNNDPDVARQRLRERQETR